MITRKDTFRPVIRITPREDSIFAADATLSCGHELALDDIDGKLVQVRGGRYSNGKWERWDGSYAVVGEPLHCINCAQNDYLKVLQDREPQTAMLFPSREELQAALPRLMETVTTDHKGEWGPIHIHGDKNYVQIYLGQHEWLSMNILDLMDAYPDPGWEGTVIGWAWVPYPEIRYALDLRRNSGFDIEPPSRDGHKPVTYDNLMFGNKEKLQDYLDPDDPVRPKD